MGCCRCVLLHPCSSSQGNLAAVRCRCTCTKLTSLCCISRAIMQSEVDTESVGHILVKKADQLKAVALVLSSQNKSKVAEFFLGSVTAYCTHRASV